MSFQTVFLIVLVAYFGVIMWEGYRSYTVTKTDTDFLIGGRNNGHWIVGASLAATQMSAGTFVGTIGIHYLTGGSFIWAWMGIWVAYVFAAIWVAPKFRRYSAEHGAVTFLDYIGDRFDSKLARGVAAVLIIIAYVVFMSAQYQAGGVIMQTLFGLPFVYGALVLMLLTVIYTAIGGMKAVMNTDFLQQVAMAIGAVIGLPLLIRYGGGLANIQDVMVAVSPKYLHWSFGFRDLLGFALAFGFTFASAPYVLVRFFTVPDDRTAHKAVAVALGFNVLIASAVGVLGMGMKVLYPQLFVGDSASTVFASQVLPPLVGALVMTAVIAAVMSTVDSVLMVTSAAVSHDIYYKLMNPNASEATRLKINRWATLIVGSLPILLALKKLDVVQFVVIAYAAILGSIVFIPVVVGLYWKRASKEGVIASMVVGFAVCVTWYILKQPFKLNPVIPGVASAALTIWLVSMFTKPVTGPGLRMFFGNGDSKDRASSAD